MNLQLRKIAILPLCLLLITGLILNSFGDVLCIGEDGQVKVESLCQPCCSGDDDICLINEDENENHDDCYDCEDLLIDGLTFRRHNFNSTFYVNILMVQPLNQNIEDNYPQLVSRHSASYQNKSPLLISTIVIIC